MRNTRNGVRALTTFVHAEAFESIALVSYYLAEGPFLHIMSHQPREKFIANGVDIGFNAQLVYSFLRRADKRNNAEVFHVIPLRNFLRPSVSRNAHRADDERG